MLSVLAIVLVVGAPLVVAGVLPAAVALRRGRTPVVGRLFLLALPVAFVLTAHLIASALGITHWRPWVGRPLPRQAILAFSPAAVCCLAGAAMVAYGARRGTAALVVAGWIGFAAGLSEVLAIVVGIGCAGAG